MQVLSEEACLTAVSLKNSSTSISLPEPFGCGDMGADRNEMNYMQVQEIENVYESGGYPGNTRAAVWLKHIPEARHLQHFVSARVLTLLDQAALPLAL